MTCSILLLSRFVLLSRPPHPRSRNGRLRDLSPLGRGERLLRPRGQTTLSPVGRGGYCPSSVRWGIISVFLIRAAREDPGACPAIREGRAAGRRQGRVVRQAEARRILKAALRQMAV